MCISCIILSYSYFAIVIPGKQDYMKSSLNQQGKKERKDMGYELGGENSIKDCSKIDGFGSGNICTQRR